MSTSETMTDLDAAAATIREAMASGITEEAAIARMRTMGLNQISCIKVLRQVLGIPLGDAKVAVHYSQSWADRRESNDALHEAAFAAAKESAYVEERID